MIRYEVWNKTDNIVTPVGEVLTPEQWMERYPVAKVMDTVCAGGAVKGAFFGIYDQMIEMYENQGCDFSECTSKADHLAAIEIFENNMNNMAASLATTTDEARIADALEDLVVLREIEAEAETEAETASL